MGRPPCCEKSGVKKGPWSPEEDLLLVSHVQKHGPGNWRAVPAITGLMRCSKSCRLRWTNYLRPGIKRGNFNDGEEKLIIEFQGLIGNKWSTIASYMPDRTDNDIKNYWNSHLKKKVAKMTGARESDSLGSAKMKGDGVSALAPKRHWERWLQTDIHSEHQAFKEALSMDIVPPSIKPEPLPLAQLPVPAINPMIYTSNINNITHSCTTHTLEGFNGTTKVEGSGSAGPGPLSSLAMLENWLLSDDMVDPCKFF